MSAPAPAPAEEIAEPDVVEKTPTAMSGNLLDLVKRTLEMPEKGAATAKAGLRDLLVVTWAVPVEQLQPLVPAPLVLDRLPGPDGESLAFVQVAFALRLDARWSPLPSGSGDSYHAAEIRALVRSGDKPGVFVLKAMVGHPTLAVTLYPLAKRAEEARFIVYVAGNPATGVCERMSVQVSVDSLQIQLVARARADAESESGDEPTAQLAPENPFSLWGDLDSFLTRRDAIWHEARLPKGTLTLMPQHRAALTPQRLVLEKATVAPLAALGIDIREAPSSVHYQHAVTVTTYPPRTWKVQRETEKPDAEKTDEPTGIADDSVA